MKNMTMHSKTTFFKGYSAKYKSKGNALIFLLIFMSVTAILVNKSLLLTHSKQKINYDFLKNTAAKNASENGIQLFLNEVNKNQDLTLINEALKNKTSSVNTSIGNSFYTNTEFAHTNVEIEYLSDIILTSQTSLNTDESINTPTGKRLKITSEGYYLDQAGNYGNANFNNVNTTKKIIERGLDIY